MTLSGLWKNRQSKSIVVSGPSATFGDIQYELVLEGVTPENELPYLKLIGEGKDSGKFLGSIRKEVLFQ
ncbi:hypothetical protein ICE98_03443 [Lactococcus lactis]|nr:hypothetical protein [Lactococcus lactis]